MGLILALDSHTYVRLGAIRSTSKGQHYMVKIFITTTASDMLCIHCLNKQVWLRLLNL